MKHDPRDDLSGFAGNEHMFFGLSDWAHVIRDEVERGLRQQRDDSVVEAIRLPTTPKFLTLGKKVEGTTQMIVSWFGCCAKGEVDVRSGGALHRLATTVTLMCGRVDERGHERMRFDLHVGGDAAAAWDDDDFRQRFLAFRASDAGDR